MSFIPINSVVHTLVLGRFDTEKEAKTAYIKYLKYQDNFDIWLKNTSKHYKKSFNKELNEFNLEEILFADDNDEEYNNLQEFWEEIDGVYFPPNIESEEIANYIPGNYYNWIGDFEGKNHLEVFIHSLETGIGESYMCHYLPTSNNVKSDSIIKKFAKQFPCLMTTITT